MPWPKCEVARRPARAASSRERMVTLARPSSPRQVASNATGARISQPLALAIESGRQR